jgi:hypothetical protein
MNITQTDIDRGADALRQFEQGGRTLRRWDDLPTSTKKKWRAKAEVVARAIVAAPETK